MTRRDWFEWHDGYDQPGSVLARRLVAVRDRIRQALDELPPGPVRVVSLCAGQARDLVAALDGHPRRADVSGRLVELDPRNVAAARAGLAAAGLSGIEVVEGDAARTELYADVVPADLVLVCGLFGNITDDDIRRVIAHLPGFCAPGAHVAWTRHRQPPDLVPDIDRWFAAAGFEPLWISAPTEPFGVGAHRFTGPPRTLPMGHSLFTFVGHRKLSQRTRPNPR
jgi:SAM-dependent methyltransferase